MMGSGTDGGDQCQVVIHMNGMGSDVRSDVSVGASHTLS